MLGWATEGIRTHTILAPIYTRNYLYSRLGQGKQKRHPRSLQTSSTDALLKIWHFYAKRYCRATKKELSTLKGMVQIFL